MFGLKVFKTFLLNILPGLTVLFFPEILHARTWHILNDGSGDAPTVQAGIDSAAVGDTVLVGPGTYMENLSIVAKDIVFSSEAGPAMTILDGSTQQDAVIYLSGQTQATVVEGFTITGGVGHFRGTVSDGGGIHLTNGASPIIRNNHILQNGVLGLTFFGGGIVAWTESASPIIENNLVEGNIARLGGAVSLTSGNSEIRGNVFRNNSCPTDGGAIYAVFNSGFVIIETNQFWENTAGDHGGAIHIGGTTASEIRITWNLFSGNTADGGGTGDTGSGGAISFSRVRGSISNNTIVESVGLGESVCSGGGVSLENTPTDLDVSSNIFAFNRSCGISCRFTIQNTLGPNLFWMNEDGDLGSGTGTCPAEWAQNQIFVDPQFCGPEGGNYTVSVDSPALTGPVLMGVWTTPGCGPGVAVRPITWGRLKALYR